MNTDHHPIDPALLRLTPYNKVSRLVELVNESEEGREDQHSCDRCGEIIHETLHGKEHMRAVEVDQKHLCRSCMQMRTAEISALVGNNYELHDDAAIFQTNPAN
ncbi:hypothetical protein [Algisphaera agarilytica]|uniref:NAD-dependent dihydropyrimidine dehydrogenase PreA subunit n=1 Tax=Algisphaera agarilytica TaxID=1385975 RepID=A0A7X0H7Z8_9BACT|nr:hypothetical protein [Algisphaera agarilytica]MBB6429786.1 NAD-dependent dihydropyrimidine dehydrogenase PreA subunit [Algisphaera agarilytica]